MRSKHATARMITLFLLLSPAALGRTTWYVNGVSGSDGNNCKSPASACRTIGQAISLAASGDSIMVGAAKYTENLTIGISLTIVGSGAAKTIVDGGGVSTVLTISSGADIRLSQLTLRNGYASSGGGIYNSGTLTISNSVISANTAYRYCTSSCYVHGGGIYNSGALTINTSSVRGNAASMLCSNMCYAFAGGIWNGGTLVINSSTVNGNDASVGCPPTAACYGDGGGILNYGGTTTISRSTISGNNADLGGGIENQGTLTLTNSTLSGNSALSSRSNASGGAISNVSGATLLINSSTISSNSAHGNPNSYGGGIYFQGGTATLQNSIVADNTVASDASGNCYGTITSTGYNLSSDGTCSFNSPG